ncbi:MAG: SDR family NAD(P)-dependent oxidoreductase [Bdellovibrionota bacterium]
MQTTKNTILITGGGSGIGLGLAQQFKERGNTVLIANRSLEKLEEAKKLGFEVYTVDLTDETSIEKLAQDVLSDHPELNVLINNAGIMKPEILLDGGNYQTQKQTIQTNLLAPMQLTETLLPHLAKQPSATIINVTSGLAFVPLAMTPTYSATKAGLHSYTESLRFQLRDTNIQVIELAPPYVQTTLTGQAQSTDPRAMPLDAFIEETMQLIETQQQADEVLVENVRPLRNAAAEGIDSYKAFLTRLNESMLEG